MGDEEFNRRVQISWLTISSPQCHHMGFVKTRGNTTSFGTNNNSIGSIFRYAWLFEYIEKREYILQKLHSGNLLTADHGLGIEKMDRLAYYLYSPYLYLYCVCLHILNSSFRKSFIQSYSCVWMNYINFIFLHCK